MKTASKKEEEEDEEDEKKKKARVVDRRGESLSSSSSPPPYRFSTEAPVYFDSSAWSTIRQSFRIAVSHSTVFVCDRFLGDQMATEVAKEVAALSTDSRFLFVADSSAGGGGASRSVHLTEHCAQVHGAVDCMALLVYKLARFVSSSSSWTKATVKITEFLDDSTLLYNDPYVSIGERTLKCLYFPTRTKPGGGGGKKEEERAEEEKCVHLRSSSENLDVRTKGDRLIAFWKDGMTERTAASKNSFVICITLHRRS